MTVHITAGCKCGAELVAEVPTLPESGDAYDVWRRDHQGPGHGLCGVEEARRIAKREKVKG